MFIVAEKKSAHGLLVVVTDKELLGKVFSDKDLILDLTKEFYKGVEKNAQEVKQVLEKAYVIHFTGKKSVMLGVDLGLVDNKRVLFVKNIPHAETMLG